MNLISQEARVAELKKFLIPNGFIENIGNVEQLRYILEKQKRPTFIYPILKDFNVIPVYNCGEIFYVLTYNHDLRRIIKFELEDDEVYKDYGLNWNLLLLDLMIDYFDSEIEDVLSPEEFQIVGEKLGFMLSRELYSLRNLPIEEYNAKFLDDETWRFGIAKELNVL